MKILIASDHAGFELKKELIFYLTKIDYEVEDRGPFEYSSEDDYPDFIIPLAREISENVDLRGIVIGGSGQGEAMVANRFEGIRAVVYCANNLDIIKLSRKHNDANILSLGARFLSARKAKKAVKLWLETSFSGEERHLRRLAKIKLLGGSTSKDSGDNL
jgi:ribose 5-phosphate isomerase B